MKKRPEKGRSLLAAARAVIPALALGWMIGAIGSSISTEVARAQDDASDHAGSGTNQPEGSAHGPGGGAPAFFPIDEIEIGMRGVGRTVFQGTKIEEFGIEILGVLRNSRPLGDLILFRGHGEILEHAGIIRGMSGSPVYIDGKLVGAVSFAYPGTLDPIGAITPIGEMLPLLVNASGDEAQNGGRTGAATRPGRDRLDPTPGSTALDRDSRGSGNWSLFEDAWQEFLTPSALMSSSGFGVSTGSSPATASSQGEPSTYQRWVTRPPTGEETGGFAPLATPVSMSGWSSSLAAPMAAAMQGLGFAAAPVPGGMPGVAFAASETEGSGASVGSDARGLHPGSSVGVRLIGGDADLVAIGTVTYVDSDRVLAFGHPMIQAGEVAFPMTGAWIHAVIPNRSVSMKMGSSTDLVGGVWNDRRTGIAGAFGTVPATLPVRISIEDEGGATQEFAYSVVRDKSLTPFLLPWIVANSYLVSGWVSGDAYVETITEVYFDGGRQVRRVDKLVAEAPGVELGRDATIPATLLLINPWEEAHLDSVRVEVKYEPGNRSARIIEVRRSAARVHVGDTVRIEAVIEPFRGEVETCGFDLEIPDAWAGRSLEVLIGGTTDFVVWDQDRAPEKMIPHDLSHMMSMIESVPDDSQINMRVYAPETGILIRGEEIPDLPVSLAKATRNVPHVAGPRPISGSLLEERHLTTRWVVSGGERISLEVAEQ